MKIKNKHLRKIHIYCSLFCCTLLLIFSLTGITLNHRSTFEGKPSQTLNEHKLDAINKATISVALSINNISLNDDELKRLISMQELSLASPGKRLEVYIEDKKLFIEASDFGFISQLNELHQGRYTSVIWTVVSDLTALIFIFIAVTGVWLSLRDNKQRRNYLYFLSVSLITFILFME
ncbi:PepSY-associated TM helix domain-containing protein [Cognaticolwellia mytili]|uniref:PepSY-associated TM helix domain-containing protein n=1 Tax=Cognaticolwellia mytili TaxID=1888913 RepID=UPI000A16F6EC|nr:PepSY-associated TM helix domain-containing protein [Cognaticolwellia mytili]